MIGKTANLIEFVPHAAIIRKVSEKGNIHQTAAGAEVIEPRLDIWPAAMYLLKRHIPVLEVNKRHRFQRFRLFGLRFKKPSIQSNAQF